MSVLPTGTAELTRPAAAAAHHFTNHGARQTKQRFRARSKTLGRMFDEDRRPQRYPAVKVVLDTLSSDEIAVMICAGANGFCTSILFGTPCEGQSSAEKPVI